jgi:hypothetical protein
MLLPLVIFNALSQLISYIPWAAAFIVIRRFGVRLYYLKKRDECSRLQKRLQNSCSHTTDGGKGYGYSFGYWYAASINIMDGECGENYTVYLIATEATYKALTQEGDDAPAENEFSMLSQSSQKKKIAVYERTGSYMNLWFRRRERDATYTPTASQADIIAAIMANHKKTRHTVVYLHGPPCTGKSMIGVLLANEFGTSFCNTLKPWQPGDTVGILYSEIEPTTLKPLILVFDEIDSALQRIHEGIAPHKQIPTAVADKPGWNHMLDEIQRGMYPDIILIMTSNRDPDFINSLDPSYIRPGRVDLRFQLTERIGELKID